MTTFNLRINSHTARILIAALVEAGLGGVQSRDRENASEEDRESDQRTVNRAFRMIGAIIDAARTQLHADEVALLADFANDGWTALVNEPPRTISLPDLGPDGEPAQYPSQLQAVEN